MVTIRVDVTQPVLDWDGTTVLNHQKVNEIGDIVDVLDTDGNPKVFTVRNAIARALTGLMPEERERGDHPPEVKDDVFRLMCLTASQDHPEFDDADRTLIAARAKGVCNALLYGRIGEAFEAGEPVAKNNGKGKVDKSTLASVD